jgi:hypothetical protein
MEQGVTLLVLDHPVQHLEPPLHDPLRHGTDCLVEHVEVGQKQGELLNVEHAIEVSMMSSWMSCLLISTPSFQMDVHILVRQAT